MISEGCDTEISALLHKKKLFKIENFYLKFQ